MRRLSIGDHDPSRHSAPLEASFEVTYEDPDPERTRRMIELLLRHQRRRELAGDDGFMFEIAECNDYPDHTYAWGIVMSPSRDESPRPVLWTTSEQGVPMDNRKVLSEHMDTVIGGENIWPTLSGQIYLQTDDLGAGYLLPGIADGSKVQDLLEKIGLVPLGFYDAAKEGLIRTLPVEFMTIAEAVTLSRFIVEGSPED